MASVQEVVGDGVLKSRVITVKKGYYKKTYWTVELDEKKAFSNLLEGADLFDEEREAIRKTGTPKAAIELLSAKVMPPDQSGAISEREQKVLEKLKALGEKQTLWQTVVNTLEASMPKVVYFSEYMRMPGQVSLNDLESRPNAKDEAGNQVFLALLGMIGKDLESLKSMDTFEHLQG